MAAPCAPFPCAIAESTANSTASRTTSALVTTGMRSGPATCGRSTKSLAPATMGEGEGLETGRLRAAGKVCAESACPQNARAPSATASGGQLKLQ
jgi:hypothetical protein